MKGYDSISIICASAYFICSEREAEFPQLDILILYFFSEVDVKNLHTCASTSTLDLYDNS